MTFKHNITSHAEKKILMAIQARLENSLEVLLYANQDQLNKIKYMNSHAKLKLAYGWTFYLRSFSFDVIFSMKGITNIIHEYIKKN